MWKRLFSHQTSPLPAYITVVSGVPRSGTSMMMRMLEAGGMDVMVDQNRPPDLDNPQGYYEFELVKHLQTDARFLQRAGGKAIKVVSALLSDLPNDMPYKILFMQRHLDEVIASQRAMLQRQGKALRPDDQDMTQRFDRHIRDVLTWLTRQPHMPFLVVHYNAVLADPSAHAQTINLFLDRRLHVKRMVAVVEQQLYRNRAVP